jgi:hypothetical protein
LRGHGNTLARMLSSLDSSLLQALLGLPEGLNDASESDSSACCTARRCSGGTRANSFINITSIERRMAGVVVGTDRRILKVDKVSAVSLPDSASGLKRLPDGDSIASWPVGRDGRGGRMGVCGWE